MTNRSLFLGLREGVRRFFAFEADRLVRETGAAAATAAPPPLVSAGRFGLIGLAELRDAMGPRWEALEGRVRELAEAVIQKHLTQGDVFELQEDGSYVVLFARLSQAETDFKCRVIGREITERLLGSDLPRLADVESVSAQVSRAALRSPQPEAALAEAFSTAQPVVTSDPASPRAQDPFDGVEVPAFVAPANGGDDPDWRAIEAEARGNMARFVATAHERAARSPLAWRYVPVWDFQSMSLVRFRLVPAGPASRETVGFDQDAGGLSKALDELSRLTAEGRRLSVICTLGAAGLSVEWRRRQIAQLLASAPQQVRRLLTLELVAPDFGVPPTLARFVESVDALGVGCALAAPLSGRDVVPSGTRLKTIAAELGRGSDQAQALSLLTDFAAQCGRVGLQSAAHGLDTRSLVIGSIAAGVRFLSGEAVHPSVDDLAKGLRFEPADLYRDLLVGARA